MVFEGASGFPLAAWLRPGTAHGAWGAADVLRALVAALRRAGPGVLIRVRGDHSLAVPAMYSGCAAEGLLYAFGYASNPALQRRSERAFGELQE